MSAYKKTISVFLVLAMAVLAFVNCTNDDTGDQGSGNLRLSFPLEGGMQDISLPANQMVEYILTLQVPPEIKTLETASINVEETLKNAEVKFQSSFSKAIKNILINNNATGSLFIKVGVTPEVACSSTISYGPYNLVAGFFSAPEPKEIPLNQPTIQMLNLGTVTLCMQLLSSVDATVNIEAVSADVTQSECASFADFSGTWGGSYSCGNTCGPEFGGPIQLSVTQNGASATYQDDEEYSYTGTVCGDVLRFQRSDLDETENGTLTLIDENFAIKRSTYRSVSSPNCYGNCVDSLYRVIN